MYRLLQMIANEYLRVESETFALFATFAGENVKGREMTNAQVVIFHR